MGRTHTKPWEESTNTKMTVECFVWAYRRNLKKTRYQTRVSKAVIIHSLWSAKH